MESVTAKEAEVGIQYDTNFIKGDSWLSEQILRLHAVLSPHSIKERERSGGALQDSWDSSVWRGWLEALAFSPQRIQWVDSLQSNLYCCRHSNPTVRRRSLASDSLPLQNSRQRICRDVTRPPASWSRFTYEALITRPTTNIPIPSLAAMILIAASLSTSFEGRFCRQLRRWLETHSALFDWRVVADSKTSIHDLVNSQQLRKHIWVCWHPSLEPNHLWSNL